MIRTLLLAVIVAVVAFVPFAGRHHAIVSADEGDRTLFENEHVMVAEYVFPAGFKGDEHEAPVNEFAYVLEGEFSVVTKGKGKTVVRKGQVEFAPKGARHYSLNETKRPARVLVVHLKER
jgi:quercetin dioxygenase-like cupin family protein